MASASLAARPVDKPSRLVVPPGLSVVASTCDAGWRTLQGAILEGRLADTYHHSAPDSVVTFLLKGVTKVESRRGERETKYFAEPGSLTVTPAGEQNSFRTDRWTESLNWVINSDWLTTLAEQEWNTRAGAVELVETSNRRDADLWGLGQRLANLLRAPIRGARLYAESLQMQVAIHLLWNYSSLPHQKETVAEHLTDPRLRRVIDFIHASLGDEVSLAALADVAGLSPNYFLGAFKQATGRTPHRYLTEQRIAKACELLEDPHRSITDVAFDVGFSSQSHLTVVFRRFMKTTPASFREQVLSGRQGARASENRGTAVDAAGQRGEVKK